MGTVTADRCAVQFVGAGPGAADLLTVRATRLLTAADTVLYPGSYLDHGVLESCSPAADLIDTQNLDLDEIVARIVDAHRAGRQVVRLVSGDPTLYSAVSEQTSATRLCRRAVGDHPGGAGLCGRGGASRSRTHCAAGRAIRRADADPRTFHRDAGYRVARCVCSHSGNSGAALGNYPHSRSHGRTCVGVRRRLPCRGGVPGHPAGGARPSWHRRRHRRSGRGGRAAPRRRDPRRRSARRTGGSARGRKPPVRPASETDRRPAHAEIRAAW